jgi:hypothetical protein
MLKSAERERGGDRRERGREEEEEELVGEGGEWDVSCAGS